MTLAAVFATKEFAVAVADRRRTQLESGVQLDDVRKIHQINSKVVCTFAGIYIPVGAGMFRGSAEQLIKECSYLIDVNSPVEEVATMFSRIIKGRLSAGVPKDTMDVTFHFAGMDRFGRFAIARVSRFEDFEPVTVQTNDRGLIWSLSRAEHDPTGWLEARIASLPDMTPESVQELALQLVEHTATHDRYVSEKFDMLTIQ
ncbi:hypothetical protein H7B90_12995 [Cohnella xylanilytica]|uniref:Uncharacterized protein n=1 Tax=Cohnella xylanilytica TaxID=557555 RepID=A0A841U2H6_9BACL|nr:hypothetical protein [Cohnella xylanilytica]MBB6692321.1 hypothetical protein [Cohnella xylanilytica]